MGALSNCHQLVFAGSARMPFLRLMRIGALESRATMVARLSILLFIVGLFPGLAAAACEGAKTIRLHQPVTLDKTLQAQLRALPPLKVLALDSPPMVKYDASKQLYTGVAVDILCFVTRRLGIDFEIAAPDTTLTVADLIRRVQSGDADVFIPLSYSLKRAEQGYFTKDFYASYYAIIARKGSGILARSLDDLSELRVGYVSGFSLIPVLRERVPGAQLQAFSQWTNGGLFDALQAGQIDVAIFSQQVFTEKRYSHELFDLEIIHILYDEPRGYRFYFSTTPEHELLVEAFDRYLTAMDLSASLLAHQDGERSLLERYVSQRNRQTLLLAASVSAAILALFACVAVLRHRRLSRMLRERNAYIEAQHYALEEANHKLELLSQTDPLTLLPNRRYFDERGRQEYQRYLETGAPLSILIIDVDHFKTVNDAYGHATGDAYLRTLAQALSRVLVHDRGMAARYGGEEFTCLLAQTPADEALEIAERIRQDVEQLRLPNAAVEPGWVTISIGVATLVQGDAGLEALFAEADSQLYQAKRSGRNRVCAGVLG